MNGSCVIGSSRRKLKLAVAQIELLTKIFRSIFKLFHFDCIHTKNDCHWRKLLSSVLLVVAYKSILTLPMQYCYGKGCGDLYARKKNESTGNKFRMASTGEISSKQQINKLDIFHSQVTDLFWAEFCCSSWNRGQISGS